MKLQVQKDSIENEEKIAKIREEARKDHDKLMVLRDSLDKQHQRQQATRQDFDLSIKSKSWTMCPDRLHVSRSAY